MKKWFLYTALIGTALGGLANCSKSGGGGGSNPAVVTTSATVCTAGSVYTTQYGCLPASNCTQYGSNYGWNSTTNQCILGTTNISSACGTNMVFSAQYGCLASCGTNSGWLNGQCVSVASTVPTCTAGQIYSYVYNSCLQQCGASSGMYNNQCVYVGDVNYSFHPRHRRHAHDSNYYKYYGGGVGFNFSVGF
jgi:hypothetical protein